MLSGLRPEQITDPVLIAAAQTTVEVDQVLFPINKKSTQKEPLLWPNELRGQGVPGGILGALQRGVADLQQATLRAKKAVACLLFVSGRPMNEIEGILTQFWRSVRRRCPLIDIALQSEATISVTVSPVSPPARIHPTYR